MKAKDELRQLFVPRRMSLEGKFVRRAGEEISARLEKIKEITESGMLAAFHPSGGEPDIGGFLEKQITKGKEICFPRFNMAGRKYEMAVVADFAEGFVKGRFGILEPKAEKPAVQENILKKITWLVPGIAFDRNGGRLGHGKGIFDRLLSDASGFKIGICYEWQMIESVPSDGRDVMMDMIVTESAVYRCS
ncbi:MAG TPA: 5-formyltetrahydrofolate cyclo-ligase [Lentisphaeria bacterium]|nr:MAG: 5-formyltetrahydrofolate cyclo-ligase [Lentisphaerae bacterium GWF2_49_21]HBC87786.1 5-formyltetrahydrofolate cyclo-ligase [Lentisphaeria bacterium]